MAVGLVYCKSCCDRSGSDIATAVIATVGSSRRSLGRVVTAAVANRATKISAAAGFHLEKWKIWPSPWEI